MAYGNGAPDIFSAIAAFSHSTQDNGAAELGIEALLGKNFYFKMYKKNNCLFKCPMRSSACTLIGGHCTLTHTTTTF